MKLNNLLLSSLLAASAVTVFGSSSVDNKIVDSAKASYNYRTLLEDKVTVKAHDGAVTLTGTVADANLRDLASDTVSGLPGVLSVDNQILLDPEVKEHSDAWIAFKIRYLLLIHANVSTANTKVLVKDGIVTLTGTVENSAQKELTGEYAKDIDWVKSVNNQLIIQPSASKAQAAQEAMDDASITSQIRYALLTHKSTSAIKTKISTNDGVVVITGTVANDAERSLVNKLALSVRGVKSVVNNVTVKG